MELTPYHARYFAHELTKRSSSASIDSLTSALADAQVDLNPHQVEAALFAFRSPLSQGAILADEVGLGKTIEAGILLLQRWAERRRRLLVICPANLRKQWSQELADKFFLQSAILETKTFNEEIKRGNLNPFEQEKVVLCSYQFARTKDAYIRQTPWDLVVIDEAHRLRNVYKTSNKIANAIKLAITGRPKTLLTATPLQNSLLELYGLVSIIDEFTFGDLRSFRSQFSRVNTPDDYRALRERIRPVCQRTLRRQVLPYISYPIKAPSGREILPPNGTCWRFSKTKFAELVADHRITFGKDGNNRPCLKRFLSDMSEVGIVPMTVWHYAEVGENRIAASEVKAFNSSDPFNTPKPEALMQRIISIASVEGEIVLDSFAGSGTTGAVAHKMGRRWIMVELGEHCHTHIIPRLKKVIDGEDAGGVTGATEWKGGGGFRYYQLAPSLLEVDSFGNLVISKQYNAAMLAQAMCKLMGFSYEPGELYWQQGHSTENDYIYVTTQTMTRDHLAALSEEVGKKRSLLICCSAFRGKPDAFHNLTLKKIPSAVLHKCEWGHDDYSLNVANLPQAPGPKPALLREDVPLEPKHLRKRRSKPEAMPSLFDGGAE